MCGQAEGWDVWREQTRRARVAHKCCACGEAIPKGVVYMASAGAYDGQWSSYKHCDRCWAMVLAIGARMAGSGDGVDLHLNSGELWADNFGPPPPELVEVLFAKPGEVGFGEAS